MTATFREAYDEMLTIFKNAWDTTGYKAVYTNKADDIPDAQEPWARVTVQHLQGGQASLAGDAGTRRYERAGLLTVQLFAPNGPGLGELYDLGKLIADAYEGAVTPSQVWFRGGRFIEVGPDGEWFQGNFLTEFLYEEIK